MRLGQLLQARFWTLAVSLAAQAHLTSHRYGHRQPQPLNAPSILHQAPMPAPRPDGRVEPAGIQSAIGEHQHLPVGRHTALEMSQQLFEVTDAKTPWHAPQSLSRPPEWHTRISAH